MERGELYRVLKPSKHEPKKSRVYVIISRRAFIKSKYQTVVCVPIYTNRNGLLTEVFVGI
jgi:mRNA-degrading endonuclease toxin of MazEF toxin-antitoxin module